MRKRLALLAPIGLTVALYACENESESSSSGAVAPYDAGNVDAFPGAPVVPEAGVADAPADTVVPPSNVTVFVTKVDGTPAPDVDVVFHDPAGAVIASMKTGADGKATSSGAAPAMATALLANGNETEALTWVGVQAGDELRATSLVDLNAGVGAYDLAFTGGAPNAVNYYANVGVCYGQRNDANGPITVGLVAQCVRAGATNAALVLGTTSPSFTATHAAFVKNVAHPNNGVVAATLGAFQARTNVTVTATNRPQQGFVSVELAEIVGTTPFHGGSVFPTDQPATALVTPGFADAIQTRATLETGDSLMSLGKRWAGATTSFAIDYAQVPPRVTGGQVDATNPKRPKVSWMTSAALTGFDGGAVRVRWFTQDEATHGWTILIPPSATSVQAPDLPAALGAKWAPAQAISADPVIGFIDVDAVTSEAAFRREAGRLLPTRLESGLVRDLVLPAGAATYRATEWNPNFD